MPTIIVYTVPGCPRCAGVLTFLQKSGLDFEERCLLASAAHVEALQRGIAEVVTPTLFMAGQWYVGRQAEMAAGALTPKRRSS